MHVRPLRGSVLTWWRSISGPTTPSNLDFFYNEIPMRIIRPLRKILVKRSRMSICRIRSGRFSSRPSARHLYFLVETSRMTISLIRFLHVQIFNCKYALSRFTFTGLAPGVSGKTEEETVIRKVHKSPSPHVMSVLQVAAPWAFGTCILYASGEFEHV